MSSLKGVLLSLVFGTILKSKRIRCAAECAQVKTSLSRCVFKPCMLLILTISSQNGKWQQQVNQSNIIKLNQALEHIKMVASARMDLKNFRSQMMGWGA